MNFLVKRVVYNISAAAKQFEIVRNKYLVPSKPNRPLSAYILFGNDQREKLTGSITQIAKQLGEKWKTLTEEEKKPYYQQSRILKEKHDEEMSHYNKNYVEPFKKVNVNNLLMKSIFADEKIPFTESGKKMKEKIQKMTPQQKKELQDKVTKLRQDKDKVSEQFAIPQIEFKTQRSFLMRQAGDKKLSELTEAKRKSLEQKYQKYLQNYQKSLAKFASKFNLTLHDFNDIVKSHERKQKRLSSDTIKTVDETLSKVVPKKKVATKKAVASKAKKTTIGSRVKRPVATKKVKATKKE